MTTKLYTGVPRSFAVGFDPLFDRLEEMVKHGTSSSYPPHNVIKIDDEHFKIELAVAGFTKYELDVTQDRDTLIIESVKNSEPDDVQYLHQGISKRKFKRQFTLAEYVNVESTDLTNGILTIILVKQTPEDLKPRKFPIP